MNTETLTALKRDADALAEYWKLVISDYAPSSQQWYIWLGRYPSDIVKKGIDALAIRAERGGMSIDEKKRYASACMRNIASGVGPKKAVENASH